MRPILNTILSLRKPVLRKTGYKDISLFKAFIHFQTVGLIETYVFKGILKVIQNNLLILLYKCYTSPVSGSHP